MQTRQMFANIILRYFAGDASLGPEIEANAASDHPINQAARDALDGLAAGEKRARELNDFVLKTNEACGSLEKRARSVTGEVQRGREDAEKMVEYVRTMHVELKGASEALGKVLNLKTQILNLDDRTIVRNEQGRERLVVDLKKQDEVEAAIQARKNNDIIVEAQTKIQAMELIAEAEARIETAKQARVATQPTAPLAQPPAPVQPVPPPPTAPEPYADVACFLPDDHTTVRKTYKDTYPRFKPHLRKDEAKFLNEAQTRVRQAYEAAHGGARPRRVREERQIVDMFPVVWGGVMETLATMHREAVGFGQQTLHSFVHHVVHHNAPRTRFGPMAM